MRHHTWTNGKALDPECAYILFSLDPVCYSFRQWFSSSRQDAITIGTECLWNIFLKGRDILQQFLFCLSVWEKYLDLFVFHCMWINVCVAGGVEKIIRKTAEDESLVFISKSRGFCGSLLFLSSDFCVSLQSVWEPSVVFTGRSSSDDSSIAAMQLLCASMFATEQGGFNVPVVMFRPFRSSDFSLL